MNDIQTKRHSLAHIMAMAVLEFFPTAKIAFGPPIENGFYYDFDIDTPITEKDFAKIENEMRRLLKSGVAFVRSIPSKKEAKQIFSGEPYKTEALEGIADGQISVYQTGKFVDLCAGPHVENSKDLSGIAFKLDRVNGAYWKGDSSRKMLQRIYAIAFETQAELDAYFTMLEEAKRRDHRVLGPALDLFFLDDTAPGMPYWLPHGLKLFNNIVSVWRKVHERENYHEFAAPQINSAKLWKTSGHWDHYQSNMFLFQPQKDKEVEFALKPMSCPNAINIYNHKVRSYRDLPLRLSDIDVIHRNEAGGTLHGLLRVQMFRQDDSHNFISEELVEAEFENLFEIADEVYAMFGIKYRPVLSTRPDDFMGEKELWDKAESALKRILSARFGEGNYQINEGDGAFYGPKIDLIMTDALGREWQTGTFQMDMQLPLRFDCKYSSASGELKTPIIIHRTVLGSLERFIGLLIEHYAGNFPLWLAPTQIAVVPVKTEHNAYAESVKAKLDAEGFRCEIDCSDSGMGKKVNYFSRSMKVPYVLILGDAEQQAKTVSVKSRSGKQVNGLELQKFVKACQQLISKKSPDLCEEF